MAENKLPMGVKLGYGVLELGGNLFFTASAFVLMNYLTDTVGLAAGFAGLALMVGRFWDAFYDPIIGFASDKTQTRMGRRRPYMLVGAPLALIAMVLMFTNPSLVTDRIMSQANLFVYIMVVYIILCMAYSTVAIPYLAMSPELTADYHERTSLTGYRMGFSVVGTLLGAGAALPIIGLCKDKSTGFVLMGVIFGGIMFLTALITTFSVKEPVDLKPAKSMGFGKTYLEVFKNGPYVLILLTYIFHIIGITLISGIAIYYFKYVLGAESMTTLAMLILLGTAMVFIPISVVIGKRVGKKLVYGAGFSIIAASLMVLFFFGHALGVTFTLVMMCFTGIGFGFSYVMPYAIVADAIEYDYLRTGERREGAFFGVWLWGVKIGQALASLIMGVILQYIGYIANLMPQTPRVELGIRLFLGPISAAIFVMAALFLYFYPITEKRYNEICAQIAEREAFVSKTTR